MMGNSQQKFDKRLPSGRKFERHQVSPRAANLAKLGRLVDKDVLCAALDISPDVFESLTTGRTQLDTSPYLAHISHNFGEMGIQINWLDKPNANIPQEVLKKLRAQAATSEAKSPIRRQNFKRLVTAFEERLNELVDALELPEDIIYGIADGHVEFNDQRFGHINPRLVAAGFPDDWLNSSESVMSDAYTEKLSAFAKDVFEQNERDEAADRKAEQDRAEQRRLQQQEQTRIQLEQQQAEEAAEAQRKAEAAATRETADPGQQADSSSIDDSHQFELLPSEPSMKKPIPSLPRGAGRALPGATVGAAKRRGVPVGTKRTKKEDAAPAPAAKQSRILPAAKNVKTKSNPVPSIPTKRSTTPAGNPIDTTTMSSAEAMKVSAKRAEALDTLMEHSRRGAKVALWRDMIGSSLPYYHNIRQGKVLFKDESARQVEDALGLPKNWLDNPVLPPASIVAWVFDERAPLPSQKAAKEKKQKTMPPRSTSSSLAGAPAPDFAEPEAPVAPSTPAPAPAATRATTSVKSGSDAKAPTYVDSLISASSQGGWNWEPTSHGIPQQQPGFMATSLTNMIAGFSREGSFTEADAYSLIQYLMARKS